MRIVTELRRIADALEGKVSEPLLKELADAKAEIKKLEWACAHYEDLRPHWAQGHSSDSIAAQTSTTALNAIWKLVGAKNQTEAINNINALLLRAK